MLLTLTTTHQPATDLGFLLRKHPDRAQAFPLPWGTAHVMWPEAGKERATVALVLEVDPITLVRGQATSSETGPLAQYVNDRPYVASSIFATAMNKVFRVSSARTCTERPELGGLPMPLSVHLPVVRCKGGEGLVRRLFEPLGYAVDVARLPVDDAHPDWGGSSLHALTLSATLPLADLLSHLYVLLPVLDDARHHWVGQAEVDKLVERAGDWLAGHPEKETITERYLRRQHGLVRGALRQLVPDAPDEDDEDADEVEAAEAAIERPARLDTVRRDTVLATLEASGCTTVADVGCGEGKLLHALLARPAFTRVVGLDASPAAVERARRRLKLDRRPSHWTERLELGVGSAVYRDARLDDLDAVVLVEVIEHMEADRLPLLEAAIFAGAQPRVVVVTTPNVAYNALFEAMKPGAFRHADHRFEWDRPTFEAWAGGVAARCGYAVRFAPIGAVDPTLGAPTQMAVFTREGSA
ncbi:MAG: 3' terminal RNA ribose 2'-O-methyltransferase Hen1 [Alphaproteobacteria bacterium]|nr:3' terminal RNA ribose 2'-O-methyltransferase Hen1 [Alphaproteobacteria bacterium]